MPTPAHARRLLPLELAATATAMLAAPSLATAAPTPPPTAPGTGGHTVVTPTTPPVSRGLPGRYAVGSPGTGDPYFPRAGNGSIDVQHYDLALRYDPPRPAPAPLTGRLSGRATISLTTTQALTRFNLDLRGLTASAVTVNGAPARFSQRPNELVITPRSALRTGQRSTVVVDYGGATTRPTDIEDALYGFVTTRDGAVVTSEPDGAATWFPCSDHPTDKATYRFTVDVPQGTTAVANGLLTSTRTSSGRTTWEWDAPDPMAAYLATATIGTFTITRHTTPGGIPVIDAVDPRLPAAASANLRLVDEMIPFYETMFGRYPFVSYGGIVDNDSVDYALETQTRAFFGPSASEGTVAHELVHQWYGNDVSVSRWADIWLNEGWATYGTWLWTEHRGGDSVQTRFERTMARPANDALWQTVMADPGPTGLFGDSSYTRGAATLHALRTTIGDDAFFTLAKRWASAHAGGDASTRDFIALAQEVSGRDLTHFFDAWAYTAGKPTSW